MRSSPENASERDTPRCNLGADAADESGSARGRSRLRTCEGSIAGASLRTAPSAAFLAEATCPCLLVV